MSSNHVNQLMQNQLNKLFEKPDSIPDVSQKVEVDADGQPVPQKAAVTQGTEQAAATEQSPKSDTPAPAASPKDDKYDRLAREAEATKKELAEMKKLLAQLGKGPEAAAAAAPTRPTVRAVESDVADLRAELADMRELSRIERDLPALPEYASLKNIPDLSRVVLAETRKLQQEARDRGEGEIEVSPAAVLKSFKENFVSNLKRHLSNPELAQELGFGSTAKPSPERPVTSRVLSSDLGSSGSPSNKPAGSVHELMQNQLLKAARAISGG